MTTDTMTTDVTKRMPTRVASDLRLLTAASRLKQFTLAELADHAGVGKELTRSFLRRSRDFESLEVGSREGRGRPEKLWRLRADRVVSVAARVAEVSRAIGWAPAPDEGPKTWQLLRSALDLLDKLPLPDEDRPAILQRAEIYLESAETELRDRVESSLPVEAEERRVVAQAADQIRRFGNIHAAPQPVLTLLDPPQELRNRLFLSLRDWAVPIVMSEAGVALEPVSAAAACDLLDMALYMANRERAVDSVLVPAAAMLSCKPAWAENAYTALAEDIAHRISRSGVADDEFLATSLAATAAIFDIDAAVDPLFQTLSNRRHIENWKPAWRAISRAALARFARPGRNSEGARRAAAACHYLIADGDGSGDFCLLATAALGARHADVGSLLHGIGSTIGTSDTAQPRDDGPLARNLGLAFARNDFAPLQMQVDDLLENKAYGPLLIRTVSDEKYGALTLRDAQECPFVVDTSLPLANCFGLAVRIKRVLEVKLSAAARLRDIIADNTRRKTGGRVNQILRARAA
jgi:hypothetical protein